MVAGDVWRGRVISNRAEWMLSIGLLMVAVVCIGSALLFLPPLFHLVYHYWLG